MQALIDNLIERGLDPKVCRLFIIDGAKALSKAIRRTFGAHTPIQRCQIHKARNVIERLPKPLHASVRRALRQAWELDDAEKAERLMRNLARRLEQEAPGVCGQHPRRARRDADRQPPWTAGRSFAARSPAPTHREHDGHHPPRLPQREALARCRDGAALDRRGMLEAAKGFRRLKAYKHLPVLRAALAAHQSNCLAKPVEDNADAA